MGPFFYLVMIQIVVFIPLTHKDQVKEAMFAAGGGKIGHYDCCSFESTGVGQFRPLNGANPFIGTPGEIEQVPEVRLEMTCEDHLYESVIKAMLHAHPYETPAYYRIVH